MLGAGRGMLSVGGCSVSGDAHPGVVPAFPPQDPPATFPRSQRRLTLAVTDCPLLLRAGAASRKRGAPLPKNRILQRRRPDPRAPSLASPAGHPLLQPLLSRAGPGSLLDFLSFFFHDFFCLFCLFLVFCCVFFFVLFFCILHTSWMLPSHEEERT